MILIKDRHKSIDKEESIPFTGKYDTYKGSTHDLEEHLCIRPCQGKYDTYKGSTPKHFIFLLSIYFLGKYDTYKGSTL